MLEKVERIRYIKGASLDELDESEVEEIWSDAEERLRRLNEKYGELPKKQKTHTDIIFPHIAVYRALMERHADCAMEIMERGEAECTKKEAWSYQKVVKLPLGKTLFFRVFALGCKEGFGPSAGFANKVHKASRSVYQMDILACPYARYCAEEGCPELTHIFCNNDLYAYGALDGIKFTRTQTLGTGGEKCDFLLERTK